MDPRPARDNEVRVLCNLDGALCVVILRRPDGLYYCEEDYLVYDSEYDITYWGSRTPGQCNGIYQTLADAERDILALPEYGALTAQ